MRWGITTLVTAAALFSSATASDAHIIGARLGDFYAGAAHPLTNLQDVLLWVALGLLAGSLGPSTARPLVLLFPIGLLAGLGLEMSAGVAFDGALTAAAMLVALGLLLATALRIHKTILYSIGISLAVICGASNAGGMAPETNILLYASGVALGGYVTLTLVMAVTIMFRDGGAHAAWRDIALRAVGSWIAAIGLMMGGLAFAT